MSSMFRVPEELSEDRRVRYDAAAARLLYPVALMVGLMYAALAFVHPLFVGGTNGLILSISAGISAAIMLTLAWTRRTNKRIDYAPSQLALIFITLIVNSTLHLYLTEENWQSTNLMLTAIAIGMAVLQTNWYLILTGLAWAGWLAGMLHVPDPYWSHWVIAMVLATLIGYLMRIARRSSIDDAAGTMAAQHFRLEEAENLAENRQNLLATISHDIRTPVTGIVGMVDLLLQRPLDARTRELVIGVQHSADGLTTLLNNLLDLARVEAGRLELNPADTDLVEVINEVVQMVGPLSQRKHVPLIAAIDPELDGWICTDSSRLKQILLNLASNAVKFTESGAVTVVARPCRIEGKPGVDIAVTDTGPGMTAEELETIFEAFVQASSGVHKRHGGSGFGLAIAQRLTLALGGDLTVTSEVGVGTTFHVLLPVGDLAEEHVSSTVDGAEGFVVITGHPIAVEAVGLVMRRYGMQVIDQCAGAPDTLHIRVVSNTEDPEATRPRDDAHRLLIMGPTATVAASPTAGEYMPLPWTQERMLEALGLEAPNTVVQQVVALPPGLRILLAEDDATNRNLIAEMLRRMGAEVRTVNDGAAAVEEVAGGTFDTVLLDLNMPVMDGLEAVRVIRDRLAGIDDLAVLALTADPGWIDRSVLTAAGFNGYVLKPTTMADLQVGITKALERMPGEQAVMVETPTTSSAQSLDTAKLQQLADDLGGPDLVIETMGLYLEELPTRLVALHRSMEAGSADEVRATAHSLKGASGMLGAMRLHELCRQMETDASMDLLFETFGEAERVEMLMGAYLEQISSQAGTGQPG